MYTIVAVLTHFLSLTSGKAEDLVFQKRLAHFGSGVRQIKIDGQLIFGGLFPVHEKGSSSSDPCGELMEARGVQRVEAMLFALDKLNNDGTLLPGIKLGALILDTCATPAYALNQSLEFVRDLMGSMDSNQYTCRDGSAATIREQPQPVAGVIGGSYSSVSTQVANLLRLFKIVQISPASTTAPLSDKTKYEYFARTVPSDIFQARVMVDLSRKFNWTYVSLVYSEGDYGEPGAEAFKRLARAQNICIAFEHKISKHSQLPEIFDILIRKSKGEFHNTGSRVVVLFTRNDDTKALLTAANQEFYRIQKKLILIAGDAWDMAATTTDRSERAADGAIVIALESSRVREFDEYFLSLHPGHPKFKRNRWLNEFWERKFECKLTEDSKAPFDRICPSSLRLDPNDFNPDNKVQFVIDAVYALAHGLHMLWAQACYGQVHPRRNIYARRNGGPVLGVCPALKTVDGGTLYRTYLLNVSFTEYALVHAAKMLGLHVKHNPFRSLIQNVGLCPSFFPINGSVVLKFLKFMSFINIVGKEIKFDEQGDGPAYYKIFNYRKNSDGQHQYFEIGRWYGGRMMLNDSLIDWGNEENLAPASQCSRDCDVGYRKALIKDEICCWACIQCEDFEYMVNETTCMDCGQGFWPHEDRKTCYNLADRHLQYMRWSTIYSIVPSVLSGFGILLTLQVIAVYIKYNDTPVVKASGRELSYILLCGMILCYAMTFVLLAKPSAGICGFKRVGVGFGFSILYSAMLVKTNRIYRIFSSARTSAVRPQFISPVSQVAITVIMASVQLLGSLIWLVVIRPDIRHFHPDRDVVVLKCHVEDHWFLVSLSYDVLLIVVCTVYAVKTRKVPENFNEAKFIGFTMYTTCIIWLAFVPIYFGTGSDFQIQTTTLCISISLSATVALFCLYSPKIWIILIEPSKNVRKPAGAAMLSQLKPDIGSPSIYSPLLQGVPRMSQDTTTTSRALLNNTEKNELSVQRRRTSTDLSHESLESLTSL